MTTTVVLVVNCFSMMRCTGVHLHVWNRLNGLELAQWVEWLQYQRH